MEVETNSYKTIVPEKSPNDVRNYQAIHLNNKLKVLLIQDITLQKSACSISVGVGSLQDPQSSLGLAHFLQHMLFMGSKKFPIHNEYSSFINMNSGMDNAYTSDIQTNYYFQIANKAFIEGVERITNFFTGALLTESCVTKQTQAVHEEYVLWTNDDNCRKWEILRKLAKGPYHRFSIGNNQTLGHQEIRNDLVKFYQEQYSSNRINAVLCSNLSIQEMKKQLLPFFQEIINKQLPDLKYQPSFECQNVGKLVRMQSIKEQTIMEFFWPVQLLKHKYKKHIDEYITHILGHEGKNSLFSYLKMKGFASEISSYNHDIAAQTIIGLEVKLTPEGAENIEEVYNIVIDYITSLKTDRKIFEEIKNKKQISFKFKQKTETYRYVCDLSSKMHHIQLTEILNSKYLFEEFDEEFLAKILKQLNPFNLVVFLSNSEELQGSITEKYLGGKYKVLPLPERKIFVKDFQQLLPNEFLPVNIAIKPDNQDKTSPRRIEKNVLFLKDNTFKVCKGGALIILHGMKDPILRQFYAEYLNLLLKQITYDAETLQLTIQYDSDDSIQIQIFGFNDTVTKLIKKIGENIVSLHRSQNSERFFSIAHEKLMQDYQNFYCGDVDSIAEITLENILINENKDIQQTIEVLSGYDYQDKTSEFIEFLTNCDIDWVFVGNFQENQTLSIVKEFEMNLHSSKTLIDDQIKCLRVESNKKHLTVLTSEQISTSGCIIYYQAGQYTEKLYYILQLLKNHIQEPFFNELRTERQLAYYLTTRIVNNRGVLGLSFILVSSSKDPEYISKEIKRFVENFMKKMEVDITEEKLTQLRESVKTKFSVPHNNLRAVFDFISKQIKQSTFYFNRKDKEELNVYLNNVNKQTLMKTWDEIQNKCLEIHVLARNHEEEFKKWENSAEYDTFDQIKEGEYFEDVFKNRKINL